MASSSPHEFAERASRNAELRKQLESPQTDEQLLAVAHQAGFEFTPEQTAEVRSVLGRVLNGELSDEELTQVAGGFSFGSALSSAVNDADGYAGNFVQAAGQ